MYFYYNFFIDTGRRGMGFEASAESHSTYSTFFIYFKLNSCKKIYFEQFCIIHLKSENSHKSHFLSKDK